MDPLTVAMLALRGVASVFVLQGKPEVSRTIGALLTAWQSGRNVDAYMAEIATALEADDMAAWDDITHRIDSEVARFLSDPPAETP